MSEHVDNLEAAEVAHQKERVEAFTQGIKAASLALMSVLKAKVAVGVITDELGQRILEDTGAYLDRVFSELPSDVPNT